MGGAVKGRVAVVVAAAALVTMGAAAPALAGEGLSPWWAVRSGSQPTNLVSGETGRIVVTAQNRGDANTSGEVELVDRLPPGLRATGIEALAGERRGLGLRGPVNCVLETLTCTFTGELHPYEEIEVDISVAVLAGASSGEQNRASVSGGGAATVNASRAIEVDGSDRFGVEDFELAAEEPGGAIDTRAGSHPFQLTSVVTLDTETPGVGGGPRTVQLPKDIVSELPAGLIGDAGSLARCTEARFDALVPEAQADNHLVNECPAESAIGVASVTFYEPENDGLDTITTPIFNLAPLPGEPARFGIDALGLLSVALDTSIRSGGDYGVRFAISNITELAALLSVKLTFWGVPGDPRHDSQRGWECLDGFGTCMAAGAYPPPPFLSLPTSCGEPLVATVAGDSWAQAPPRRLEPLATDSMPALGGCAQLPFEPQIRVSADTQNASEATGLNVDVHVPQSGAANPAGLAESFVKEIAVALPQGVTLNAAGTDGLQACSQAQIGYQPSESAPPAALRFSAALSEPSCPDAAKIGTVKVETPLLEGGLEGAVYLAAPQNLAGGLAQNPFGSLLAMYVLAVDPASGVVVKLAGSLTADPLTGQLTAQIEDTPQLPIEALELHFFAGSRATFASPATCGTYVTHATFTPWSGEPLVTSDASFAITAGPHGTPCANPLPFAPTLNAGTNDNDAGSFSPLTATIGREDGEQDIESFQLKLPPGIVAVLKGVKACSEAQANAGRCGGESLIGHTTFSLGVGSDPYTIAGGEVFLTEHYDGAPFGLSIVSPVSAGPFDLQEGRPLVVRAKLDIDPTTAALTITTGVIPHIIDGFPLQIRHLNVTIDRAGFLFNPTNCGALRISSTIASDEGATHSTAVPFQVADCASLGFAPKLTAVTRANGEFAGHGASLHLAVANANGHANIRSLKLDFPQRLPARLETVQKACREAVFAANPAACPKAAVIGTASVQTPVLPGPLRGPGYLVAKRRGSGGKAGFPDIVLVLQGTGVRIDLTGTLYVDEHNTTSTTFQAIPDVPIARLELTLPEGRHSILAASAGLCTKKALTMFTAFVAQDNARTKSTVTVAVEGCRRKRARRAARSRTG